MILQGGHSLSPRLTGHGTLTVRLHHYRRTNGAAQRIMCLSSSFPDFIPSQPATEIQDPAAREMLHRICRVQLDVSSFGAVDTAFVSYPFQRVEEEGDGRTSSIHGRGSAEPPVFVLLHGFDSSLLEFRRFAPLLARVGDVYAVDLAGWGFTDCGFSAKTEQELGPEQKREHLKSFLERTVGRPVILMGTSLGGAVAVDFASNHPDLVEKMILIDAQGFIDGIGPLATMPRFLSVLGVQVLRSVPLRQLANKMAYYDVEKFATDDAMRVGRLHTFVPGWVDANVAFMRSGGYTGLADKMKNLNVETLVVWGRQDEILSPEFAERFVQTLPNACLEWIEECGHLPALEQPYMLLETVHNFVVEETKLAALSQAA